MTRPFFHIRQWVAKVRFDAAFRAYDKPVERARLRVSTRALGAASKAKTAALHAALRRAAQ